MPTLTQTPLPRLPPKLAKTVFSYSVVSPHFQNSQEVYICLQNLASDLQGIIMSLNTSYQLLPWLCSVLSNNFTCSSSNSSLRLLMLSHGQFLHSFQKTSPHRCHMTGLLLTKLALQEKVENITCQPQNTTLNWEYVLLVNLTFNISFYTWWVGVPNIVDKHQAGGEVELNVRQLHAKLLQHTEVPDMLIQNCFTFHCSFKTLPWWQPWETVKLFILQDQTPKESQSPLS